MSQDDGNKKEFPYKADELRKVIGTILHEWNPGGDKLAITCSTGEAGVVKDTIQQVKDFWDAQPCDIGLSDKKVGSKRYWEDLEREKYAREPDILDFAEFYDWIGQDVLEIGCGLGCDTLQFARMGARVTAVDLSAESIKLAKERLDRYGYPAEFYQGNAEALTDFVPTLTPFDLIYSWGVIHHSPNPELIFQELDFYALPETELRVMLYAKWSARALYKLIVNGKGAFWRFNEILRENAEFQYGCPVAYYYSAKEARQLIEGSSRFRVTSIEKSGFRWRPRSRLSRWLGKFIGSHLLIKARQQ